MRIIYWKRFLSILVVFSVLMWIVLARFSDPDDSIIKQFIAIVPKIISIDGILFVLFATWGWKVSIFKRWLVLFPNLNGSWVGLVQSDWVDPETGKKKEAFRTMLTIKQTFFNISCVMHTQEMKSNSYSEGFNIDPERQIKQLSYLYSSKPKLTVAERSKAHDGAVVLDIIENPDKKLKGCYWNDRKRMGEIELSFKTGEILDEMPED